MTPTTPSAPTPNWAQAEIDAQQEKADRIAENEATKSSPSLAQWPDSVLNPPGLVGDVTKWILASSGMEQPKFALAASLTLCGALLGRGVKDYTGQRTNIYSLVVGATSAGKNDPMLAMRIALQETQRNTLLAGEVTSDTALEILMSAYPVRLFLLDEVGHYITSLKTAGANNGHLKTVMPVLTKVWSCANGSFVGKARATDSNGKWKPPRIIQEPCACLYGTTAPDVLFGSMAESDFKDGSIPRFLSFISKMRPIHIAKPSIVMPEELQNSLIKALLTLGIPAPGNDGDPNGAKIVPTARLIPEDGYAAKCFQDFEDTKHANLLKADNGDSVLYLWGKAVENARRVALTVAALKNPASPCVSIEEAQYAVDLVTCSINDMVAYVRDNVASTKEGRIKKYVLRAIRQAKGRITQSDLTRATRQLKRSERNDAIDDLLDAELISMTEEPGIGTKKVTVYRLIPQIHT